MSLIEHYCSHHLLHSVIRFALARFPSLEVDVSIPCEILLTGGQPPQILS